MTFDPTTKVTFTSDTAYSYSDDEDDESSSSSFTSLRDEGIVLGFDDGEIDQEHAQDEQEINVSRIGGRASFPLDAKSLPPADLLLCPQCSSHMLLLTQIYAPFSSSHSNLKELSSPYPSNKYREEVDRLLYVYGCIQKKCLGVRCLRSGRRNAAWAKQGRQERKAKSAKQETAKQEKDKNPFSNPFASSGSTMDNPFSMGGDTGKADFGSLIFGGGCGKTEEPEQGGNSIDSTQSTTSPYSTSEASDSTSVESVAMWPSSAHASIPARYLATSYEELSSSKSKQAKLAAKLSEMHVNSSEENEGPHKGGRASKSGGGRGKDSSAGGGGDVEGYEVMRLAGVEAIFLAFQERLELSGAPDQLIRYEFGGTPLPFNGKSKPFEMLWTEKAAPGSMTTTSRQAHAAATSNQAGQKKYDVSCSAIEKCQHCGSNRTFEIQLMPHLVSIVERSLQTSLSSAARTGKGKQADTIKGEADELELELGWATVWCYVCIADCLDAEEGKGDEDGERLDWQGWREEVALVELEG